MVPSTADALVGSLVGATKLVGLQQREILRDLFGKGDDVVSFYNPRVVAYVGGDAAAGDRQDEVVTRGGIPVVYRSPLAVLSATRRWESEEGKSLEEETWSTTAKDEDHKKNSEPCLDVVPYTKGNEGAGSENEDTDEEERLQFQFHQSVETSKLEQDSGSTSCRGCGNRAKNDCHHQRCRTCCRSHGFTCVTHLKSTWVPAAKRREKYGPSSSFRLHAKRVHSSMAGTEAFNAAVSLTPPSAGTSPRDSEILNSVNPTNHASSALHSSPNLTRTLPSEVRAQTVFKCVRVTRLADEHNEFAYQATVKIGGRMFKGVLYDQGPDIRITKMTAIDLQLAGKRIPSTSSLINHMELYGSAGGGIFLEGMHEVLELDLHDATFSGRWVNLVSVLINR